MGIYATNILSGGIVAEVRTGQTALISNCEYSGTMNLSYGSSAGAFGGAVGLTAANNSLTISKFAMTGSILASNTRYVGGIIGDAGVGSLIEESYVYGKISGALGTGGLAHRSADTKNNFVVGDIIPNTGTGAGHSRFVDGTFIKNFYIASYPNIKLRIHNGNTPLNEITNSIGTSSISNMYYLEGVGSGQTGTGITSRTPAQMSSSLAGLTDNTDVWKYAPSGYPYPILKWMEDDFVP